MHLVGLAQVTLRLPSAFSLALVSEHQCSCHCVRITTTAKLLFINNHLRLFRRGTGRLTLKDHNIICDPGTSPSFPPPPTTFQPTCKCCHSWSAVWKSKEVGWRVGDKDLFKDRELPCLWFWAVSATVSKRSHGDNDDNDVTEELKRALVCHGNDENNDWW